MADSTFPSLTSSVDVSSYRQPQATSFVDSLKSWQGVESNKLTIDKQKLDLVNQNYGHLIRELTSLGPNPAPDAIQQAATNAVKLKLVTPEMASTFVGGIPTDPTQVPNYMKQIMSKLLSTQEAVNVHYGQPGWNTQGQQQTPTLQSPFFGVKPAGQPQQIQNPPNAVVNNPANNQPTLLGPQAPQVPQGSLPVENGLPGQFQAPAPNMVRTEAIRPKLPVAPLAAPPAPPAAPNPVAVPPIDPRAATFNERFAPAGPAAAPAPGVAEAQKIEAEGSANALNTDRIAATGKGQGLIPLQQALRLLPGLTTGIGTEPFNKARAALINLGFITPQMNDPTVIYQEVNKKLSKYIETSGLANRSDAAQILSQSANPNIASQLNPALINLTRDAISLDRSDILRPNSYEGRPEGYNKHRTSFPQTVDQKALHFDTLPNEERRTVLEDMNKRKPNDPVRKKFERTLELGIKHGLYTMDDIRP